MRYYFASRATRLKRGSVSRRMKRQIFRAIGAFVALGLFSALVSVRAAENSANAEIGDMAVAIGAPPVAKLSRAELGRVPIPQDLREYALTQGAFGRWLARGSQFLPLGAPPEAWKCAEGRLVGPFLVAVDSDAVLNHGSGAHILIGRTLYVAVFGWSRRISAWVTGASYSGVGRRLTLR